MNQTRAGWLGLWCLCGLLVQRAAGDDAAVVVEPSELARRVDLVGREIVVDDRIRYFLESKRGQGYDELVLKRTEVPFHLLVGARLNRPPSQPNAVVRGTLKQKDGRLVCEVATLNLEPNDTDRLDAAIGRLRPDDFATRRSWAAWAERRGRELNDPKLAARGSEIEGETLWAEASRVGADPIALANAAASRPVPGELRAALYHRGFRKLLDQTTTGAGLDDLARRVLTTFPHAAEPKPGSATVLKPGDDPAAVYRSSTEDERARMNRQLYADLIERALDSRLAADPSQAMSLVEEARRTLSDRPSVAERIHQRGLAEAERGVTRMRQSEVEELARTFRDAGQADRARTVLETWLEDRRKNRLSPTDAEGRILLAANYEKLVGDRATASELLREADRIDPQSRSVADAFLRLGYRKGDAGWYDPSTAPAPPTSEPAASPRASAVGSGGGDDSLRGLTQAQARSRMGGKPDRVVRSLTQGILVEQWIYRTGRTDQYILFRSDATTSEPRVSASYAVQQTANRP